MENFRQNPDLRRILGKKAYDAYIKYWSEDYHINKYYQLILEIAERKKIVNSAIHVLQEELQEQMCYENFPY